MNLSRLTRLNNAFDNAQKLALITFFSSLYFYIHVNTLYLQTRGLNLLEIRTLESIIILTIFLTEVPTGIIADRIGRKWSVVLALAFQALGEILYLFSSSFSAFVFIAILAGIGFAFLSGAKEALIYDSLPEDNRDERMQRATGNLGSAYQLAFFVSPLIGGLLVSQLVLDEFMLVIFMTACSVTLGLLISFTLQEPPIPYTADQPSSLAILREGWQTITTNPRLRHIFAVTVLTATFSGTLVGLYQPHFVDQGISPFFIGAGLSLGSLVAVFTQRYAYKLETWFGARWGIVVATVLPGVLLIVLATITGSSLVFLAFVLAYGTANMRGPLLAAAQNRHIPDAVRATTLSIINMFGSLYVAGVGILLGAVAVHSVRAALLISGVLVIGCTILTRADLLYRYADKLPPSPDSDKGDPV
ncbi:MFS transporter [Chloroflexota bacterium]